MRSFLWLEMKFRSLDCFYNEQAMLRSLHISICTVVVHSFSINFNETIYYFFRKVKTDVMDYSIIIGIHHTWIHI